MRELLINEISTVVGAAPIKISDDIQMYPSDILYISSLVAFATATFPITLPVLMLYKSLE